MNKIVQVSLCGISLLVAGCDSVKSELGLDRHTPDEFAVMQRAPLEIPTDLNTLPVPQPGMARPQDLTAKELAERAVVGDVAQAEAANKAAESKPSAAENVLMNKVGASKADAGIRSKIEAESKESGNDARPVMKKLLGLGGETATSKVVDAEAEAKRIKAAKAAGKPITDGETPSIED